MSLIKRKKTFLKSRAKSNLVYSKDFTFCKYQNTKKFARRSFNSKRNDLIEFKYIVELFYDDAEKIQPNNEAQKKRD